MSASPEASTSALPASDAAGSSAAAAASTSARKPLALRPKKAKAGPSPGIVYISRIPPGMTPHKIKHLMSRWGETGKVFAQKDEAGVKGGKAHSVNYTEAWIEFLDKQVAKSAAAMLNAQTIGGHKGEKWRDDIWTMKYLPGFKWTMLGEQMAYERNSHTARLRQELSKSKAEQAEYLKNVELARVLDKRRERAAASGKEQPKSLAGPAAAAAGGEGKRSRDDGEGGERKAGGGGEVDKRKKRKLKAVSTKRAEGERKLEDVLGSVF